MLSSRVLDIDAPAEIARVAAGLREIVGVRLRRRGVVVGVSGGVDSAVCAALAVEAFGAQRVLALLLPERESAAESSLRARCVAEQLGVETIEQDISATLEAVGCYQVRDSALHKVFPGYGPGWSSKLVLRGGLDGRLNHFVLVAQSPDDTRHEVRPGPREYLQIVAATNYKQRIRKAIEYHFADRRVYAVVGTPNRLEYDQGFFVKNGDGAADVKPIAHLYKSQVYALARQMGLPEDVCRAHPTTDTYSMVQGQDEFYFALPYAQMDLALWAHNHGVPAGELADALGVDEARARNIYRDIERKRAATAYQHLPPLLIEPVSEV